MFTDNRLEGRFTVCGEHCTFTIAQAVEAELGGQTITQIVKYELSDFTCSIPDPTTRELIIELAQRLLNRLSLR